MQKLLRICTFIFCLAFVACASQPSQQKAIVPGARSLAEISLTQGDHRIGTYTSSWKGFRTSSYWIEGPTGLIIIDAQFLLSASEEMLTWAEQTTGKKAVLAVILHPNPDKFNGTAFFQKRGIKVVTSEQVLSHIPAVHKLRTGWFYERYKPDYPVDEPRPESFGNKTTELQAAGLTIKAHVLGKGCSEAHVVVEFDENVFVGDLVTIGFHSWLELGMLKDWLKALESIQELKPTYVRTGRGGSGDADSVLREITYLENVIKVVESFKPRKGKALNKKTEEKIQAKIESLYPSYEYPGFIGNGIAATWNQLAK